MLRHPREVAYPDRCVTPLVEKRDSGAGARLGMGESAVVKKVMLKEAVDGEFTAVEDIADVTLMFAVFPSSALTGQSMV